MKLDARRLASTFKGMLETLPDWPLFGYADDIRPALRAARASGEASALVTLHTVQGGGPRPPGAQMLFAGDTVCGFLSGGCVEGDIALHAAATLADGQPRWLVYGEGGPWPDIRLLCGARIEILVERVSADDPAAQALLEAMARRQPVVWRTDGAARAVDRATGREPACSVSGDSRTVRRLYEPEPRLAVVGADPIALAIAQLGVQAGFETHLIRPKGPAEPPPIPGVVYRRSDAALALAELAPDPWTAIAVATHDWDTDQAALLAALPSPAAYVGVLGARRRLPERLARLRAAGLDEVSLDRLRAPIGLDLGGKAPWEVAVAVIGEIIAARSAARTEGA